MDSHVLARDEGEVLPRRLSQGGVHEEGRREGAAHAPAALDVQLRRGAATSIRSGLGRSRGLEIAITLRDETEPFTRLAQLRAHLARRFERAPIRVVLFTPRLGRATAPSAEGVEDMH